MAKKPTPTQLRKAAEKAERQRELRRVQLSPWRMLDRIQGIARDAGNEKLVRYITRRWNDIVPMVADEMEAAGHNVGTNECGRGVLPKHSAAYEARIAPDTSKLLPLAEYDKVIIGLSGGKDSVACALRLMQMCREQGIDPAEKIELWHQLVDGHPDNLLRTLEMERSKYIGDDPSEHPINQKRKRTVRGQQEKVQAKLSEELREASAAGDVKVVRRVEKKLEKLAAKMEADVTPMLIGDAELNDWKSSVQQQIGPVLEGQPNLFDWPCSHGYCIALADHWKLPILFQWRQGGILGGILRTNSSPEPRYAQMPNGKLASPKVQEHKLGTRRMFPQVSADLSTRWCSSYAKIEVNAAGITADPRFVGKNVLVVTGERREESGNRSKYATVIVGKGNASGRLKRRVDQYRAVLDCTEAQIWDMMRDAGIVPHPCYWLGFSRASCATCIFLRNDEWSTVQDVLPAQFEAIARLETLTGLSIGRDGITVRDQASNYKSFAKPGSEWRAIAAAPGKYRGPIYIDPARWTYPQGAFRQGHGPT